MFTCQLSGRLSDFHASVDAGNGNIQSAYCTVTEIRFAAGVRTEIKHFLIIRKYNEVFVQKCIEKNWNVVVFAENPVAMHDDFARDAGYVLTLDMQSVQLP